MAKPKVIIVAGHGGGDPGNVSRGRTEAAEAIDIVNKAVKYIKADGRVDVVVVPHSLGFVAGINWINRQPGKLSDNILALSAHKNSFHKPAYGYETFSGNTSYKTAPHKAFHKAAADNSKLKDRGLKSDLSLYAGGLGFIQKTKFDAILTENGFMQTDHFDNEVYGLGIAKGVYKYFGLTLKLAEVKKVISNPLVKYYRVFNTAGKQLGAYTNQLNAWNKYIAVGKKGKITGLDGGDITATLKKQYQAVPKDTNLKNHLVEAKVEEVKEEVVEVKKEVIEVNKVNTEQEERLDNVEEQITGFKAIFKVMATAFSSIAAIINKRIGK